MKHRASRLVRSAAFWLGIFYLALIPVFAFLYTSLGHNSFYDSNSKREKGAYEDAAGLRDSLTSDVRRHLRKLTWRLGGHGHIPLKINPSSVRASGLEYTSAGHLLVEVSGAYASPGDKPLVAGSFSFWVEPYVRESPLISGESGHAPSYALPVALSLQGGSANEHPALSSIGPPVSLLFPVPSVSVTSEGSGTSGTLVMSRKTYEQLMDFYLGVEGDPAYASDSLWRMAYLSAVTVTTVGFGDITPVSEAARILVTIEAILGAVIVGLFLSALAFRWQRT
jgi:hypothetical protein